MRAHDDTDATDQDLPTSDVEQGTAIPSRRRFFATAAAAVGAGMTVGATDAEAQRGGPKTFPTSGPGGRPTPAAEWRNPLMRLVRRVTMGVTADEAALARQLGYAGYLEHQLRPDAIDDSALENLVAARLPMTTMTAAELATQDAGEVSNQLQDAALYRAAFSRRQLKERMVEFWTDHFTVSLNKVGYLKMVDDREVIRRHAMTTFPQLLRATSESGAMLVYLDQNRSRTPTPNQNYAREIMELHTLGVDGGYTQQDVAELSRILTGWSTAGPGTFAFLTNFHDRGAKTFLGRSFPAVPSTTAAATQKKEGDDAIQMLLEHPSTARYVSLKMARWLLAYDPPEAVVAATAQAYTRTGGNIPAMIRTILTSANLMASPAKYKRPFHFAASVLRATGAQVTNIRSIRQQADRMGMPMFLWEQPNGYPDRIDWWSGLVLNRWSFVSFLAAQNNTATLSVPAANFRAPDTVDGVVGQINARLYGGEIPSVLRAQLASYLRGGTFNDARIRETIGLALSAQQFQWY